MSTASELEAAFHRATAPIFEILTPQQARQLVDLQADAHLSDRVAVLADKANEGELSDSERAEYEGYIEANNLLATLQAEVRFHHLANSH